MLVSGRVINLQFMVRYDWMIAAKSENERNSIAMDYFEYLWPATGESLPVLKGRTFWVNRRKLPAKMYCIIVCTKIQILCAQHAKCHNIHLGEFSLRPHTSKTHRLVDSCHLPRLIFTTRKKLSFFKGS